LFIAVLLWLRALASDGWTPPSDKSFAALPDEMFVGFGVLVVPCDEI